MCIYFVVETIALLLVILSYKKNTKVQYFVLGIICILWAFVFGLRGYNVGNDTSGYVSFFDGSNSPGVGYGNINFPGDTIEQPFVYFARVVHFFSDSPTFFFLVTASLLFICVFFLYKKFSDYPVWCLLVFFVMGNTFLPLMVAMRQVVSIILLFIGLLFFLRDGENNISASNSIMHRFNLLIAVSLFIISAFAHRTSIILFPLLILLYKVRLGRNIYYALICSALVVALIVPQMLGSIFDFFLAKVGMLEDEDVALLGDRYADSFGETGASPIRLLAWTIPTLLTIKFTEKNKVGTFPFNCLILSVILYLTLNSSFMVTRLNIVFMLIGFSVFIPRKVILDQRAYLLYLIFTLYYLWRAYVGFENWPYEQDTSLPYKFFWE